MPSHKTKIPSSLNTHWPNSSLSSVNSDTATFHSAITNMELNQLSNAYSQSSGINPHLAPEQNIPSQNPASAMEPEPSPSPKLESPKMDRQDSGFSDGVRSQTSSRPTSSSGRLSKSKRSPTSSRSGTRRTPRSIYTSTQHRSSASIQRPQMRSRHTTSDAQIAPHQFFQFPTLQDPAQVSEPAPPPPPPATVHYWTSDSTRRLEYAAIDAANRGVRGFFIKLVPDCIISPGSRRTKFHSDDADSDAGSVRRYRLVLPEEKAVSEAEDEGRGREGKKQRPSMFRRWTSLGFGGRS